MHLDHLIVDHGARLWINYPAIHSLEESRFNVLIYENKEE